MKLTPKQIKIQERMQAGIISIDGFLGEDNRPYPEIIEDDKKILNEMNISQEQIAERLQYFSDKSFETYDGSLIIDEIYEVQYFSYRGKIISPFMEAGQFRKGEIILKNLKKNITIKWTPLSIHLIKEHCFFEGKGSKHRLEPKDAIVALF